MVKMLNELHRAMKERRDAEVVSKIMKGLLQYTGEHFTYEEGLQKKANYPDLDNHKEIHNKLVAQVKD